MSSPAQGADEALLRDRRGRRPRRLEPRRRRPTTSPDLLDLDDDRGVPEPAADLGARPRLLHHRAVQRAGALRLPRRDRPSVSCQRRARGGHPRPARTWTAAASRRIRPRRPSHRGAEDRSTSSASTARTQWGSVRSRSRPGTSSPPPSRMPATLGERMSGQTTCAGPGRHGEGGGVPARGLLPPRRPRADVAARKAARLRSVGTPLNPVVALEPSQPRLARVLGPESFPPKPFLELLQDYGERRGWSSVDPRLDRRL